MHTRRSNKNHPATIAKYAALLCLIVIAGLTAACSLPFKIVPNTYEEGPPPEEHWEGEQPPEEQWEEEHPPEEHPEGEEPPPEPPPGAPPPPPPQPAQPSGGNSSGPFTADVAVTDIYPGNMPQGQFHVRITNHGPGTLNKVTVPVNCQYERTDKNSSAQSAKISNISVTLSMKPGEQMSFPTNLDLDTNVYEYLVACEVTSTIPTPGIIYTMK